MLVESSLSLLLKSLIEQQQMTLFNVLVSDSSYIIINERYKVQNLLNKDLLILYVFISEYMSKVVRQIKEQAGQNFPKDTKRAVIFQGGGAIGAYAAGVYAALYYWMKKDITDAENIFDIVASLSACALPTSIGPWIVIFKPIILSFSVTKFTFAILPDRLVKGIFRESL